jgi:hypothetical protein
MSQNNKETFKDDIITAERNILIISWLGTIFAFAVMGCAFWRLM